MKSVKNLYLCFNK